MRGLLDASPSAIGTRAWLTNHSRGSLSLASSGGDDRAVSIDQHFQLTTFSEFAAGLGKRIFSRCSDVANVLRSLRLITPFVYATI
jgi:hypothetical protein